LEDTRVVFVMGPRQSGKSTLVNSLIAARGWRPALTFDDQTTRLQAAADVTGFVGALRPPVAVDEVQRVPDVLLAVKQEVDRDPRPGRFLLTGSANIRALRRVKDALTGRVEMVTLWPLAQAEITGAPPVIPALFAGPPPLILDAPVGRQAFAERAEAGGYPEARLRRGRRRDAWFANYIDTTLDRDLRDLSDATRLREMPLLLRLLAAQAAGLLNYSSLASRMGMSLKTVQAYVELLELTFLVRRIPAWRPGLAARELQAPKLLVADAGILAHLLGADAARIGRDPQVSGRIFEDFVAMELVKQANASQLAPRVYHYRAGAVEVDLVLETRAGDIVGVEAKAGATLAGASTAGLRKLRDLAGESFKAGIVLYTGRETLPLGDRIWAVPVSALWRA
jgi:predicted AAA+ superfamily ATPase